MFRVIVLLVQNEFAKRSEHGNAAEHPSHDLASNPWHANEISACETFVSKKYNLVKK